MANNASLVSPVFPTFDRLFMFGRLLINRLQELSLQSFARLHELVRENPNLSLVAVAMLSLLLILKGMTLWATMQDAAIGNWIKEHGGQCNTSRDSGHLLVATMSVMSGSRYATTGRLISIASIPVSVLNSQHEELFSRIRRLSKLERIDIDSEFVASGRTVAGAVAEIEAAKAGRALVDSIRLQQGLATLHHPVHLIINQAAISPCEHPLDLSRKITGVSLWNVHVSRDFAMGLPFVKNCTHVAILDSEIDDDAIDILADRLNPKEVHLSGCSMTTKAHARLATKIPGTYILGPVKWTTTPGSSSEP